MQPQIRITGFKLAEPMTKQEEINLYKREILEEFSDHIHKMMMTDSDFGMHSLIRLKGMMDRKILKLIMCEV